MRYIFALVIVCSTRTKVFHVLYETVALHVDQIQTFADGYHINMVAFLCDINKVGLRLIVLLVTVVPPLLQ